MKKVVIINYNLGNPKSISNMFSHLSIESVISADLDVLSAADYLILPGVGHFTHGMRQLADLGMIDAIKEHVITRQKPILGICLGMHLMTNFSEEGDIQGLGLVEANCKRFDLNNDSLKVPHMGWNEVCYKKDAQLLGSVFESRRYYFVHSYFVECNNTADVLGTTNYGYDFVSAFQHDNIYGVQFHPEKSHKFGMELLANFCKI